MEIDVRYEDGKILLGHDNGETNITLDWIQGHGDRLWVHCKNLEALRFFSSLDGVNFFWHQEDDFTLTSKKIIWTYPEKDVTDRSVIVCFTPEECAEYKETNVYGICCDWVGMHD